MNPNESQPNRASTFVLLVAVLVFMEVCQIVLFSDYFHWFHGARSLLYSGMIGCLPFLLARLAPKTSDFEIQWLPSSRWQWAWLFAGFFALLVLLAIGRALTTHVVGRPAQVSWIAPGTRTQIILQGIASILVVPLTEEIFFRGYVLAQLRKLTYSGIALLVQSLLFGFYHLATRGWHTPLACVGFTNAFLIGMVFGAWRIKFKSLLPLVLIHVFINGMAYSSALIDRYYEATSKICLTPHTISRETTYIVEPLKKDGRVDYVAALDRRFREGVTPENNAAVLMWKAVGPAEISTRDRAKYFKMLGIPPLAEKGNYFVDYDKYVPRPRHGSNKESITDDQMKQATRRPWTKREFPVLAEWLAVNEKPLTLAFEASKRPRRYAPLLGPSVICILLPDVQQYSHVASALCARAMLRLGEGKLDEAWSDLLACHRLARLVGQGPTFVEAVVALSIDREACAGDQAVLQYVHLTADQAARMRADLDRLPAMPSMADKIDAGERFTYLNIITDISHEGNTSLAGFSIMSGPDDVNMEDAVKSLIRHSSHATIDSDHVLRQGNSWYDRIADACRKPQGAERRAAFRQLDKDLRELYKKAADTKSFEKAMPVDPRKALSEQFSNVFLTLFLPKMRNLQCENHWSMRLELDKLGFALAAYRADHGRYPAKLADLTPRYMTAIPPDFISGSPLHYRLEGQGYLLYSVGVNGRDDGAKGYEDYKPGKDYDDIVIRVQAKKSKKTVP